MSTEKVWNITQNVFDEHKEELEIVYAKINGELQKRLEDAGMVVRVGCGSHASRTSNEMLLAIAKLATQILGGYEIFTMFGDW